MLARLDAATLAGFQEDTQGGFAFLLQSCHIGRQDLPKEVSGRWTWAARNATQTFALEEIQRQGEDSFRAVLTWWTMDQRCALRGTPITGKATTTGIAFDATTKCDVSFSASLERVDKGWRGTAKIKGVDNVILDLKAN